MIDNKANSLTIGLDELLSFIHFKTNMFVNTVAQQTLFVFGLPLAVGILHSTMILKALLSINLVTFNYALPIVIP